MPADPHGYRLSPGSVPEAPQNDRWPDYLRWVIAVMDADDRDLGFMASLLSYCLDHQGLTEKQAKYARRIFVRVHATWLADQLECQRRPSAGLEHDLHAAAVAGNA